MKRLTVGKMDNFDLLRRVIYPTLEENLDKAFPEFSFQPISNGWWIARNAPSSFRDYGHAEGKLIARSWGFRSLIPGKPPVFWLAYANKQKFPKASELPAALRSLASRVQIVCEPEGAEDELWEAQEKIRRHLFPEVLLIHFQGNLWSRDGENARKHLIEKKKIPEKRLLTYELGYYAGVDRARWALDQVGFNTPLDHERAGGTGIYQPHWDGRIVGPVRDLFGRRVLNIWGYRYPYPVEVEREFEVMRPLDLRDPIGTRSIPYGLHQAVILKQKNLLLVESPLSVLSIYSRGLQNPCPISSMGSLLPEQIETLEKYLKGQGTLTLNFDYSTRRGEGVHGSTFEALDKLRNANFPIYVIDPLAMKIPISEMNRPNVSPTEFLNDRGMDDYIQVLKTRVPAEEFNPDSLDADEGQVVRGIF